MSAAFIILAALVVVSAVAALSLRNLVHCALSLTVTFAALAGIYLQLTAQFVGFAQILVYIGAVAILIVFAILLTRGREPEAQAVFSSSWVAGAGVALAVFGLMAGIILSSKLIGAARGPEPQVNVRVIGEQLMTHYVLPLEVLGLLLTAALIGAVVLALRDSGTPLSAAELGAGGRLADAGALDAAPDAEDRSASSSMHTS